MTDLENLDQERVTLLDVIREQAPGSKHLVSRVTVVAKLTSILTADKCTDLNGKYENALKACVASSKDKEAVTGFMLFFPTCFAAQIEAEPDIVNAVLKHFMDNKTDLCLSHARIVSLTDDIPSRAFHQWAHAFAGGEVKEHADAVDESLAVKTASELNLKFLSFGQQIQHMKGPELLAALDSLGTYWENMPKIETLLSLLPYTSAPSIEEFMNMFSGIVNVDLESERVWPMPQMPAIV